MKIIKYRIATETPSVDSASVKRIFAQKELQVDDVDYEISLSRAKAEAYNGEVTVEAVPTTAEEARARRDKLLAASDWTQVLDAPIDAATRESYRVYRQALRDIPEQDGFPEAITWPELPSVTKADPDPVDTAVDTLLGGETA